MFDGSLTSNIEYIRAVTLVGATRSVSATTSGMAANSRRSLSTIRTPTPATSPTQALRVKVRANATISAGMTSTVQVREPPKKCVLALMFSNPRTWRMMLSTPASSTVPP